MSSSCRAIASAICWLGYEAAVTSVTLNGTPFFDRILVEASGTHPAESSALAAAAASYGWRFAAAAASAQSAGGVGFGSPSPLPAGRAAARLRRSTPCPIAAPTLVPPP